MRSLFGCRHENLSFPRTVRISRLGTYYARPEASRLTGTYTVCLDCGKEFAYDWGAMKVVPQESKLSRGLRTLVNFGRPR